MTSKKILFVLLAVSLTLISCKVRKPNSSNTLSRSVETVKHTTVTDITEDDIHWYMSALASDSMRGRKSGTPDEAHAAEYIKEKFKSLGLKAFGGNYFQSVPVTSRKHFDKCELYFEGYKGNYPADFRPMIMFDSLTVAGKVVAAGYGNDSDYENLDVKNQWVMIEEEGRSILYEKKAAAKNRGALGVLVIGKDGTTGDERYVLPADSIPMIKISRTFADRLLAQTGRVSATIRSVTQPITSQNVVAYLETDDSGREENGYIVIGAHYDHIGTITKGDSLLICNGADDNASGVIGLLEIAEKLRSEKKLKYNVLFAAFGAEELGLVGSRFFCNNPPIPLEKIKLMVNLDMIGRMDSVHHVFINTGKPDDRLNTMLDEIKDSHPNINAALATDSYLQGSDHTSFFNKHIPVLFFTTGLNSEYHTPADTMSTINYRGEKQLLDFVYDLVISPAMDNCIRSFTSSDENP